VHESPVDRISAVGDRKIFLSKEIVMSFAPILADYVWIGGGTLGLILLVVVVVLLLRK
jgi:hypothetical protein